MARRLVGRRGGGNANKSSSDGETHFEEFSFFLKRLRVKKGIKLSKRE